ncbi:MAG: response regulator [Chloroflexota bacterium]
MRKASILLADNHPELLEATSENLEEVGYRVVTAASPEEAKERLENEHLHLAILDLRLDDDYDEKDKSGLRVAQSVAPSLPKLIWTRFTNDFSVVVEALRAEVGELPPAVDFIKKEKKIGGLLKAVERALDKHVHINEDLIVHWETTLSFLHWIFDK